jgi:hypothetical protein
MAVTDRFVYVPDTINNVPGHVSAYRIDDADNRFVDRACGLTLDQKGFNPHYVDTLRLARRLLPNDERHSLESVRRSRAAGNGAGLFDR